MDFGLKGKVALVCASSRGLGRAVAAELANEGADLLLCARGAEALAETRKAIAAKSDVRVVALAADLTDPAEVTRVVDTGIAELGRIDILVTNIGGPPPGRFESHSAQAWTRAAQQNLMSVINLSRAVLPDMKRRGWGRIINITSLAAKQPVENLILSNTMRAGVTGFAKTLADELAEFGITVNNVLPGYTRTKRLEQLAEKVAKETDRSAADVMSRWSDTVPMKRLGTPEEFAALTAFLASERASYVTGTSIPIDGGVCRALL
ncbi:MAG: SDR family oxidoreductase [Proteobacteria bacterium]|nr:SDR family oxidoreductase [Pseudomonadota bacterium]